MLERSLCIYVYITLGRHPLKLICDWWLGRLVPKIMEVQMGVYRFEVLEQSQQVQSDSRYWPNIWVIIWNTKPTTYLISSKKATFLHKMAGVTESRDLHMTLGQWPRKHTVGYAWSVEWVSFSVHMVLNEQNRHDIWKITQKKPGLCQNGHLKRLEG